MFVLWALGLRWRPSLPTDLAASKARKNTCFSSTPASESLKNQKNMCVLARSDLGLENARKTENT